MTDPETVPLDATTLSNPRLLLDKLGRTRPVHRASLPDGMPGWLITGHREAREALSDPRLVRRPEAAGSRA